MQEQDPPMFNKFIFDECFIFILLIQFHLHLISFHQRFPHHLHNIFFQNFKKAAYRSEEHTSELQSH